MLKELRSGHVSQQLAAVLDVADAYDLMPSSIMLACGSKFVQQSTSQSACHFCYRSRRCLAEWVSQGLVLPVKGSSNRCPICTSGVNLEILLDPKKFSAVSWSMVEKCLDSKTVASSNTKDGPTKLWLRTVWEGHQTFHSKSHGNTSQLTTATSWPVVAGWEWEIW